MGHTITSNGDGTADVLFCNRVELSVPRLIGSVITAGASRRWRDNALTTSNARQANKMSDLEIMDKVCFEGAQETGKGFRAKNELCGEARGRVTRMTRPRRAVEKRRPWEKTRGTS